MNYDTLNTTASSSAGLAGSRTITAFFERSTDAQEAVERLVTAGIPRSDISLVQGSSTASSHQDRGFWESLKDLFIPDDDRAMYAEGLRRGGHVVTVRTSTEYYETALDILDDEGTIDIDQRAQSWRSEGWTGYNPLSRSGTEFDAEMAETPSIAPTTSGFDTSRGLATDQEVIPVAEEELHIGKRDVSHGRVRVRSYVVETPVSEQVNLRQEHVDVERRIVDRPLTDADRLFQERTIEVEERGEEAVVAKDARVREEVVIRKDVENRTDVISDTVRRTEVEVEDERGTRIR